MKVKHLLIISAFVLFVFGIGFLVAPTWSMELFGITIAVEGVLLTQLLAATFLGFGVLNWVGRNYAVPEDVRPLILANFVESTIGFIVILYHKLNGVGNEWCWVPIALYLLFALAFAYSILVKSTYEEPTVRMKHA
ncbi:MAG: hypothetical protein KC449_06375 [Anaerolineales bacterium]|nr:hypothetical protein [Anaerolineales bacterium]